MARNYSHETLYGKMLSVEIIELGSRLRARRTAAGRTIASVALDAGLSVPYIANLENGRGNPTLSAVTSLATALGTRLSVELTDEAPSTTETAPLPESLVRFARSTRFTTEVTRLTEAGSATEAGSSSEAGSATEAGSSSAEATAKSRRRLLYAMAGMGALATRPLTDVDWHRLLDAAALMTRPL
jgi:transcriptional regulator with XRE-family HTH domain